MNINLSRSYSDARASANKQAEDDYLKSLNVNTTIPMGGAQASTNARNSVFASRNPSTIAANAKSRVFSAPSAVTPTASQNTFRPFSSAQAVEEAKKKFATPQAEQNIFRPYSSAQAVEEARKKFAKPPEQAKPQQADSIQDSIAKIQDFDNSAYVTARDGIASVETGVTADRLEDINALRPESKSRETFDRSLEMLERGATEGFEVDRVIADAMLSRFDASSVAASKATMQKIAANPNLSAGAKNAFRMESIITQASQRSDLAGQLAMNAMERSYQALGKLSEMSLAGANLDEEMYKTNLDTYFKETENELKQKVALGEISMREYEQMSKEAIDIIELQIDSARLDLDKQIALEQSSIRKEELKAVKDRLKFDFLDSVESRSLDMLRDTRASYLTDAELQNEYANYADYAATQPHIVQAVGSQYQLITGNEMSMEEGSAGRIYFDSVASGIETTGEASRNELVDWFISSGAKIDEAEKLADVTMSQLSNAQFDKDSITVMDPVTGEPDMEFVKNESGEWESVSLTQTPDTSDDSGQLSASDMRKMLVEESSGVNYDSTKYNQLKNAIGRNPTFDEYESIIGSDDLYKSFILKDNTKQSLPQLKTKYDAMPEEYKEKNSFYDIAYKINPEGAFKYREPNKEVVVNTNDAGIVSSIKYGDKDIGKNYISDIKLPRGKKELSDEQVDILNALVGKQITIDGKNFTLVNYTNMGAVNTEAEFPTITIRDDSLDVYSADASEIELSITTQGLN